MRPCSRYRTRWTRLNPTGQRREAVISGQAGVSGAIAWFHLDPIGENGFEGDISTLYDFVDDYIIPELERVEGVSAANIYGGREAEIHVIADPTQLALRG